MKFEEIKITDEFRDNGTGNVYVKVSDSEGEDIKLGSRREFFESEEVTLLIGINGVADPGLVDPDVAEEDLEDIAALGE